MAAARLGCKVDWLHECTYLGGSFLARKAVQTLNGCLLAENTDYCMLVNGVVKVMSLPVVTYYG